MLNEKEQKIVMLEMACHDLDNVAEWLMAFNEQDPDIFADYKPDVMETICEMIDSLGIIQ